MLGQAFRQLAFYLGHNEIDELLRNFRRQVELLRPFGRFRSLRLLVKSVQAIRDADWIRSSPDRSGTDQKIREISLLREPSDTMARRWVGRPK